MNGQDAFRGREYGPHDTRNPAAASAAGGAGALPASSWDFYPVREKWAERGLTALGFGGFAVAAALLMGPLALAGTATYSAGVLFLALHKNPQRSRAEFERDGTWHHIDSGKYARAFHAMVRAFGLPDHVRFYAADKKFARSYDENFLPLPLRYLMAGLDRVARKIFNAPAVADDRYGEQKPFGLAGSFHAHTSAQAVVTTVGEIRRLPDAAVRFVLAHELAHIKTQDGRNMRGYANFLIKELRPVLLVSCLFAPVFSAGIFAGPLAVATGMAGPLVPMALLAISSGSLACFRAGSRICERRADRNAMFMVRDEKAIAQMGYGNHRVPPLLTFMSTHPLGLDRVENLQAAFTAASAYEAPDHKYVASPAPSKFARGQKADVKPWGVNIPA